MPMLLKWNSKKWQETIGACFQFLLHFNFWFFCCINCFLSPCYWNRRQSKALSKDQKAFLQKYAYLQWSVLCITPNHDDKNKPPTTTTISARKTDSSCFGGLAVIAATNDEHQPSTYLLPSRDLNVLIF